LSGSRFMRLAHGCLRTPEIANTLTRASSAVSIFNKTKGNTLSTNPPKRVHIGDSAGPTFEFEVDGLSQKAHKTWFRGEHCNYNPNLENMRDTDAVTDHVLAGWIPAEPTITHKTNIIAFGSCFATHITNWLANREFNLLNRKDGAWGETYIARFGEGMANSHAILQQFEWALEGKAFTEELWHDKNANSYDDNEAIRLHTKSALLASDFFIITLGLSEVWCDKASGDVFWRAVPQDKYDPEKHVFRVSSHSENLANIQRIYQLIRAHRPKAKVMFTLSPVPLVATFRPVSCITANAASKAILRSALDEFLRAQQPTDANLHYWPSYEIAMDVFSNRWCDDRRHIKPKILDFIMTAFEHSWCVGTPQMGLSQAWVRALCSTGGLPRKIYVLLESGEFDKLDKTLANKSEGVQNLVNKAKQEMAMRPALR